MKKEKGITLIMIIIIIVVALLLVATGVMILNKKSTKTIEDNDLNSNQSIIENTQQEELTKENEEEKNYEIVDETQMFNWVSIDVKGKGLQDSGMSYDDPLVNNFSANINSKASEIMKQYPNSAYGNKVYFSKLDNIGSASILSNVEMDYDQEKDNISCFYFDIYTADEFYINDFQLVGLKSSKLKEKLGEPYAIVNDYYVYRYNNGYILINFLITTRYVQIVKNEYTSNVVFLDNFLNDINN